MIRLFVCPACRCPIPMPYPFVPKQCHCGSQQLLLVERGPGVVLRDCTFEDSGMGVVAANSVIDAKGIKINNVQVGFHMDDSSGGTFDDIEHTFTPPPQPSRKERRRGRRKPR